MFTLGNTDLDSTQHTGQPRVPLAGQSKWNKALRVRRLRGLGQRGRCGNGVDICFPHQVEMTAAGPAGLEGNPGLSFSMYVKNTLPGKA